MLAQLDITLAQLSLVEWIKLLAVIYMVGLAGMMAIIVPYMGYTIIRDIIEDIWWKSE